MRQKLWTALFVLTIGVALATPASAQLSSYSQDFEALNPADPGALTGDGWLVFGNVFNADGSYAYGYGPFPAPTGGAGFCAVAGGAGGPDQGAQHLVVYSDYNNAGHSFGQLIEANVFQEQVVGAGDVGNTMLFQFDAKRDNLDGGTTTLAFYKVLDPAQGFALTQFITVDMTSVPASWGTYSLTIDIDASMVGTILQFGFLSMATGYEGSGVLYDNISFDVAPVTVSLDVRPGSCPNPISARASGVLPVAIMGTADFDVNDIDVSSLRLAGVAPITANQSDEAAPTSTDSCDCSESGPDGWMDLALKFRNQDIVAAIGTQSGVQVLNVTGTLLDGTSLEGQDCVLFVGGGNGNRNRPDGRRMEVSDATRGGRVVDLRQN
jgi:hypothetical protein